MNHREYYVSYRFDPDNGGLSLVQTVSTIPTGDAGVNSPADIHVQPNGKFVFGVTCRNSTAVDKYKQEEKLRENE